MPMPEPSKLNQLQFEYAWKWFNFHADQRTKMFNFMLIVLGIFATAVVSAYDKHLPSLVTAGLCFIAAALAIAFALLDQRNQDLVRFGEEILAHLEGSCIFGGEGTMIKNRKGADIQFGILVRQTHDDKGKENWCYFARTGRHRFWLPAVSCVIAALFGIAGGLILYVGDKSACAPCIQL